MLLNNNFVIKIIINNIYRKKKPNLFILKLETKIVNKSSYKEKQFLSFLLSKQKFR